MSRPQIALVSREIRPFGGGIGTYVAALARFLGDHADVSVFVSAGRRDELEDPEIRRRCGIGDAVRLVFVEHPPEPGSYYGELHRYSDEILRALRREYGRRGPDVIEFQDYLGEGAVTLQARRTGDPFLHRTQVLVRLNTTAELCAMLDGYVDQSDAARHIFALERFSLRFADRLLYGGGDIYGLYERMYGAASLAPGALVRQPLGPDGPLPRGRVQAPPQDGPLRLLFLGRLERRKGVVDLVESLASATEEIELTLVGGDTTTAPLGTSMRAQLQQSMVQTWQGVTAKLQFIDHLPPDELPTLIDSHHLLAVPSIWECWPAVGLEALARNRPLLGTPVGGLVEMAQPRSGWLLDKRAGRNELAATLDRLARERVEIDRLVETGGPRAVHDELCSGDTVREWYLERLMATPGAKRRSHPRGSQSGGETAPLVSVIVPYYQMAEHVEETLESAARQSHPRIETIVVNDGSFRSDDRVLIGLARRHGARLALQPNGGLGAARNLGVKLSRGRYVLPLDADNLIEPAFVARAVAALELDSGLAFVSCWSRYIDEAGLPQRGPGSGYQPLGNWTELLERENAAADGTAVIRRSVFDRGYWYSEELTSYEDWDFYHRLRHGGLIGHCIPERLMRYRVRADSMVREVGHRESERLAGELAASWRSSEVIWRYTNV